jgi:chromosome segregation ATPase
MTDKDKEAFREFIHKGFGYSLSPYDIENYGEYRNHLSVGWSAACEYKDKEILEWKEAASSEAALVNELQSEIANLREQDKILSKEIKTYIDIANRLQAENAELKQKLSTIWEEAEKFYLDD